MSVLPCHRAELPRWGAWLFALTLSLGWVGVAWAGNTPGVEVDDRDEPSLVESAIRAFDSYLGSVDAGQLEEARAQVLDPGSATGRLSVVEKLLGFIRARTASRIENEGVVVRIRGDWALVVYQYDTTVRGQTTRVITTAWMIQAEGYWRQFVVAPEERAFWDKRRADFDALQAWFDQHAREIASRGDAAVVQPTSQGPAIG
ncbi:MAG: hypothetical protein ACIAXF_17850 [Phycisphaerales bacterium JB063]